MAAIHYSQEREESTNTSSLFLSTSFNSTRQLNVTFLGGGAELMSDYVKAIVILFYGAVIVVAFGGNVTVCCIVATNRRMRTVTNYFIVSLACSDILMATLCIPMTFVANVLVHYWPFGHALCPVVLYSQVVSVFLSAFTMLAISIDRYRAVIFPLRPRLTTTRAFVIIAVTWALALIVSLPVAIFARVETNRSGLIVPEFCDEIWPDDRQRSAYSMAVMALQYFLPLAVLSFTYVNIGVVIWVKRAPGEAENTRDQRLAASKRKMVKMMITVVIIYALCWLPIHTITLIGDTNPDIWSFRHIQTVWVSCHWLAMSNSCYNPIVYCWMNDKFRSGFYHAFRWCPCVRRRHSMLYAGARMSSTANGREMSLTTATVVSPGGCGRTQKKMSTSQRGIPMMTHYVATSTSNRSGSVESARTAALDTSTTSPYSTRRNQRALAEEHGGQRSRERLLYDELMPVDGRKKNGGGKLEIEEYSMKILR